MKDVGKEEIRSEVLIARQTLAVRRESIIDLLMTVDSGLDYLADVEAAVLEGDGARIDAAIKRFASFTDVVGGDIVNHGLEDDPEILLQEYDDMEQEQVLPPMVPADDLEALVAALATQVAEHIGVDIPLIRGPQGESLGLTEISADQIKNGGIMMMAVAVQPPEIGLID